MKILILKPSSLGDIVQALPVLRLLKRHLPESQIYWWIASSFAPLLEGDPDLTGIIRFERRQWAAPRRWPELWRSIRWMRQQNFDWVIDLQSLARSGAVAWLANGGLTLGLDEPREGARGFYDLIAPRPSFHTHAVDWYLGILRLLGVPAEGAFQWLPPHPEVAASVRKKWPISSASRWIILQPGARWVNKRWPAEYFSELVTRLGSIRPELRFAILGAREERHLAENIVVADPRRCLNLAGETSLPEMVEWIRLAELMVTNDTGPMHVAAALEKPVVAMLGPTEPRRTGPYRQLQHVLQSNLPCIPCLSPRCRYYKRHECLRAISPATVVESVLKRLG